MFKTALSVTLFFVIGCGVKGKPLPPENPPFIGEGIVKENQAEEQEAFNPKRKNKAGGSHEGH